MKSFRSLVEAEDHLAHMPGKLLQSRTSAVLNDNGTPAVKKLSYPEHDEIHHLENFDFDDFEPDDDRDEKIEDGLRAHGWSNNKDEDQQYLRRWTHPSGAEMTRHGLKDGILWKMRTPK